MAKEKTETKNLPAANNIYEGFSPEEIAEMLGVSGQSAYFNFDKTPTLKINLEPLEDKDGATVKVGNFVLGQRKGKDDSVESIGEDFGPTPEIVILTVAQQYNYYHKDKAKRCASQIVMDGDVAIGGNLGFSCSTQGACPRRGPDVVKAEKCTCQYLAFCLVGPEKKSAIMYLKGSNFIPFKEYLEAVGKVPFFFCPTRLTTKREKYGSVTYFVITPEFLDTRFTADDIRAYRDLAAQVKSNISEFVEQKKIQRMKQLPPGTSLERPGTGGMAGVEDVSFEDIKF